ncbi:MAG: hypothetical protein SGPRY_012476 [Prymnesium sp.]
MGPLLIAICNSDGFQCSAKTKGLLLSAFSLGYLSSQVFGGVLADRIGAEAVVFISSIGGALLMAASGFASTVSELWLCQVLMGVCHGPLFPTSIAFLTKWIPADERAFASTLLDTGITAGAMIALPFSGLLASAFGWRHTFMLYALGSLAFAIIWLALASSDPADCKYISSEEEAYLRSAVPQPLKAAARVTWPSLLKLLAHPAVLSIFLAHAAFNYCVYFINSWSPTFYQAPVSSSPICLSFSSHSHLPASHLNLEVLAISPAQATVVLMMPPIANCAVKIFAAGPIDEVLKRSLSTIGRRRFFSAVGFVGSSLALLLALPLSRFGLWGPTAAFSVANAMIALHPSEMVLPDTLYARFFSQGFKANYMDVSIRSGGTVAGVGNTIASLASYAGPLLVAWLLQQYQSWGYIFLSLAIVNAFACVAFVQFSTASPLDVVDEVSDMDKIV